MRALAAIGLLLLADPAVADTTAVYSGASSTVTVEVATNGDARVTGFDGAYLLQKADQVFFVVPDPSGRSHVFRVADIVAVQKERADAVFEQYPGLRTRTVRSEEEAALHAALVVGGEVIVHGRKGIAYLQAQGVEPPILVISRDPSLAPLRGPMLMSERFAYEQCSAQLMCNPIVGRMVEALKTGAPLELLDSELTEVGQDPISSSRFELPSLPETRDQVRLEFEAPSPKPNH